MTEQQYCRTQLLPDEPAVEDTFGGPHNRLATAIADLIHNEDGGKAIGLEGGWGSGKSTVVKLVTRALEGRGTANTQIAVFDVWAHQGDPLRRTFLEKLIRHLQEAGWVDRGAWNERAERLAKRRREETQRVIPQLTSYGTLFALSLLAIPLGSAMVAAGGTALAAERSSATVAIALLAIGLIVVLAPLLVLGLFRSLKWWRQRTAGPTESHNDPGGLFALVTGQATMESKTSVTETPDPTSVEFESTFRKLCDEALNRPERKLVLAIDNLDRVPVEGALAVWATLQTFLQYSEHERPEWFARFWVLAPFDSEGIRRLWGDGGVNGRDGAVAESFLDKTFQIRFRIPPPVISHWQSYLAAHLAKALPDHAEDDYGSVLRAFALHRGVEAANPTPRDLKLFVNEIGAIHRQWGHTSGLSLADFAVFVLLQRDGAVEVALRSTTADQRARSSVRLATRVLGENWRDAITCLYFNAPLDQARQMLLREPIETALGTAKGEELRDLEEAHGEGYWAVFEDSVPAGGVDWSDVLPEDLARAAIALESANYFEPGVPTRPELVSILERVRAAAAAIDAWQPFTEETAQGLVALCSIGGHAPTFTERILRAASAAEVQQGTEPVGMRVPSLTWMRAAHVLLTGLDELGVPGTLAAPLSDTQWFEVLTESQIEGLVGSWWARLELQSIENIDTSFSRRAVPNLIDDQLITELEWTLRTGSAGSLGNTADRLLQTAQETTRNPLDAAQVALTMRAIVACYSAGIVDDEDFRALATDGFLLHHLHQAVSEAHPEAAARCAFMYLSSIPDAREPDQVYGNSARGHGSLRGLLRNPGNHSDIAARFVGLVNEGGGIRELARILDAEPPESALLNQTFAELIEQDPAAREPDFLVDHWEKISVNLQVAEDEDSAGAFSQFVRDCPSVDEISSLIVEGNFDPRDAQLYLAVLSASDSDTLSAWSARGLQSVASETWAESLSRNDALVQLLLALHRRQEAVELGTGYLDGLVLHAKAAAHAEDGGGIKESLPELFDILDEGNRDMLARRVYEALEETAGQAPAVFFDLYGEVLDSNVLLQQPRFVDLVCRPLLTQRNARGLQWLAERLTAESNFLSEHSDSNAVQDFHRRVRDAFDSQEDGQQAVQPIRKIARALGIASHSESDSAQSEAGRE